MDSINIKRTQSTDIDFSYLTNLLDLDLNLRYKQRQSKYDKYNKIPLIDTVVILYDGIKPIGCGCFKIFEDKTVEIKRMFVIEEYRGKGFSKSILSELEKWAVELAYTKSVLETGKGQPEAIGLYTKYGYHQIDNFGQYANIPDSVCFEKNLSNKN